MYIGEETLWQTRRKRLAYQGGEIFCSRWARCPEGAEPPQFEDRLTANISRRIHKVWPLPHLCRQSTVYVEPLEASCDLERAWAAIQPVLGVAGLSRAKACEKDKDAFF